MARWNSNQLARALAGNSDLRIDMSTVRDLVSSAHDGARKIQSEHDLQTALFVEIDRIALVRSEYAQVYAIPNGQYRPGQRMEPGIRAGYPDVGWDLVRGGYHGLRMELKVGRNDLSADQIRWRDWFQTNGFFWACVRDRVSAGLDILDRYWRLTTY